MHARRRACRRGWKRRDCHVLVLVESARPVRWLRSPLSQLEMATEPPEVPRKGKRTHFSEPRFSAQHVNHRRDRTPCGALCGSSLLTSEYCELTRSVRALGRACCMVGTPKSEALFLCFRADDDDDDDATSIRKAGGRITLDTLFEKSPLDHSFAYAAGETRWRMQINWRITVACRRKAPQFQANTVRMRPFAVKAVPAVPQAPISLRSASITH